MDLVEARGRDVAESERHPWERARLQLVRHLIGRRVPLPPGSVVLDIGCGDLFVTAALARTYPAVDFVAIDTNFSEPVIHRYRERLGLSNLRLFTTLDDVPSTLPPASLVLLMDVIEHVEHEVSFLRRLGSCPFITAGTCFLITVPSFQRLFSSHDRFLGHYRRYSNKLLRERLQAAGLTVDEVAYIFASLIPLRIVQVLKERLASAPTLRDRTQVSTWNGGPLIGRMLTTLLALDARVVLRLRKLGIPLPGLSSIALCRKSA